MLHWKRAPEQLANLQCPEGVRVRLMKDGHQHPPKCAIWEGNKSGHVRKEVKENGKDAWAWASAWPQTSLPAMEGGGTMHVRELVASHAVALDQYNPRPPPPRGMCRSWALVQTGLHIFSLCVRCPEGVLVQNG